MIIIICGPEIYLAKKRIDELIKEKSDFEIKQFDLEEENYFQFIKREFFNNDLFTRKKFFILKNASKNKDFQNSFLQEIKKFLQSPNLILFFENEEKRDGFLKILKKYAKIEVFNYLTSKQLETYVKKIEQEKGIKLEPMIRKKIIQMTGGDLWLLENELEKLKLLGQENISQKTINEIISPVVEINIFETIEKIGTREKKEVLLKIFKHLKKDDSPLYLLSMFAFQLKRILSLKDLLEKYPSKNFSFFQKQLNIPYFLLPRLLKSAKNFKTEELKKLYEKLFFLDLQIKKGEISPHLGLFLFLKNI